MKIKAKNMKLKIGYFALSFLYMQPMIISIWPKLDKFNSFLNFLQISITLLILFMRIMEMKRLNHLAFWGPMIGLISCVILSNWFTNKLGLSFILNSLFLISFLLVVEKAFKCGNEHILFGSMTFYFILITGMNLYSQIQYGINGIYHDWTKSWQAYYVCGNANSFVFFYLTGVGVSMFYAWKNEKCQIISYLYHLVVVYSLFYSYSLVNSSTGLVILGGLFICRLLSIEGVKRIIVKYYKQLITIGGLGAAWLILFNGWKSKWLLEFLNTTLGESESFIERGMIWHNAVENILKSPVWGYGSGAVRISSDIEGVLRSAHNNYLQLMIQGGISAFIFYLILIWNCIKRHNVMHKKAEFDTNILIAFFLITYLFEQNPFYVGFYLLLFISFLIRNKTSALC